MWGEGIAEAVQAHGKMDKNFALFPEKPQKGQKHHVFSPPLPLFPFLSSFQGSCADFWVWDSPFWLCCSFFAPAHLAVLPQRDQHSHLDGFFCIIWVLAGRKKTFGVSSRVGRYKEMPRKYRNANWNGQTELHLGGVWGKIRDFNLKFGKKAAHAWGFACAFVVQGMNVGWLHPKKLQWCSIGCPLGISLRYWIFWRGGKWNLGLHNPTRNNCSQLKISQGVPRQLVELFPKKEGDTHTFLGLFKAFLGWWKGKKGNFSSSAPHAAEFEAPSVILVATFFPQHREGKAPQKVWVLTWVPWKHQTT